MEFKTSPGTIAYAITTWAAVGAVIGWRNALAVFGIQLLSAFIRHVLIED